MQKYSCIYLLFAAAVTRIQNTFGEFSEINNLNSSAHTVNLLLKVPVFMKTKSKMYYF